MNLQAISGFVEAPWTPEIYGHLEIMGLFDFNYMEAQKVIDEITGGGEDFVAHHELVPYLKDHIPQITEIPLRPESITAAGLWLLNDRGWSLVPRRQRYRWSDPQTRLNHTLPIALKLELQRYHQSNSTDEQTVEILDIEDQNV